MIDYLVDALHHNKWYCIKKTLHPTNIHKRNITHPCYKRKLALICIQSPKLPQRATLRRGPSKAHQNRGLKNLALSSVCGSLIESSDLVCHSPHNGLPWGDSHQPGEESLPEGPHPFLRCNAVQRVHHSIVPQLPSSLTLSHESSLHHIKGSSGHRAWKKRTFNFEENWGRSGKTHLRFQPQSLRSLTAMGVKFGHLPLSSPTQRCQKGALWRTWRPGCSHCGRR